MHAYTIVTQKITPIGLLWLIPLLPFVGAAVNGLVGKRLQDRFGKGAVHAIAIGAMCGAAALSIVFYVKLLALPPAERYLHDFVFPMVQIGSFKVNMAFALDPLSALMALIITVIGTLIHIYSVGYMHDEPATWRYFSYLNLFVFSMLLLVLGDNFLVLFFGWEGVGLCSYLLIGFWYTDLAKARAGMKAFVVNRIGDFGFVTGFFLLFWGLGGTWVGPQQHAYARDVGVGEIVQAAMVEEPAEGAGAPGGAAEHRSALEGRMLTNVPVGPTVTFRELRDQLAVTDARTG